VIGLRIARAVSERWQDLFLSSIFELGMATSTRNSGVNHRHLLPKILEAQLSWRESSTYEFCAKHKVPFVTCGKLVVAVDDTRKPNSSR